MAPLEKSLSWLPGLCLEPHIGLEQSYLPRLPDLTPSLRHKILACLRARRSSILQCLYQKNKDLSKSLSNQGFTLPKS